MKYPGRSPRDGRRWANPRVPAVMNMVMNQPGAAADEPTLDSLWSDFKATDSDDSSGERLALRNQLLTAYLPLVRQTAERIHMRLPQEVDLDDLIQAGTLGLKDAIESFNPSRKVKFETFSAARIRGAILDELRHLDWVPRLVRRRSGKLDRLRARMQGELGRPPTEAEMAQRLGVTTQDLPRLLQDARPVAQISLSREWFDGGAAAHGQEPPPDIRSETPDRDLQQRDLQEFFTRGLNPAEKRLVVLYYYEDMTMDEISRRLGLSESRVSQMHSSIIERLKKRLAGREMELTSF